MRTEQVVLSQLESWASNRDSVRTMILVGSRADPRCTPDLLSDYDVEVFVQDIAPFVADDSWLEYFGSIMVRWPARPRPTFDDEWATQLALFDDGVRIDFQFTSQHPSKSPHLDSGYRVILDKDHVAEQLPPPTFTSDRVTRPTREAFDSRMNAFWWDIVYVAKSLWRGELNYAKYMLDWTIRFEKLQPLLEWYAGLRHDWSINTGMYGRWFHRYLDPSTWEDYEKTFADASTESNWEALFATLELFRKVSKHVADCLGFDYPERTDVKVTEYIYWIRGLDKDKSHW